MTAWTALPSWTFTNIDKNPPACYSGPSIINSGYVTLSFPGCVFWICKPAKHFGFESSCLSLPCFFLSFLVFSSIPPFLFYCIPSSSFIYVPYLLLSLDQPFQLSFSPIMIPSLSVFQSLFSLFLHHLLPRLSAFLHDSFYSSSSLTPSSSILPPRFPLLSSFFLWSPLFSLLLSSFSLLMFPAYLSQ